MHSEMAMMAQGIAFLPFTEKTEFLIPAWLCADHWGHLVNQSTHTNSLALTLQLISKIWKGMKSRKKFHLYRSYCSPEGWHFLDWHWIAVSFVTAHRHLFSDWWSESQILCFWSIFPLLCQKGRRQPRYKMEFLAPDFSLAQTGDYRHLTMNQQMKAVLVHACSVSLQQRSMWKCKRASERTVTCTKFRHQ